MVCLAETGTRLSLAVLFAKVEVVLSVLPVGSAVAL